MRCLVTIHHGPGRWLVAFCNHAFLSSVAHILPVFGICQPKCCHNIEHKLLHSFISLFFIFYFCFFYLLVSRTILAHLMMPFRYVDLHRIPNFCQTLTWWLILRNALLQGHPTFKTFELQLPNFPSQHGWILLFSQTDSNHLPKPLYYNWVSFIKKKLFGEKQFLNRQLERWHNFSAHLALLGYVYVKSKWSRRECLMESWFHLHIKWLTRKVNVNKVKVNEQI